MKHFHWEWLIAGVLGLGAGLMFAWVIAPPRDGSTAPNTLRPDFQDEYRSAIASAYSVTGDLARAKARLALLGDTDSVQALTACAQRALAAGQAFGRAQELARLASDLQSGTSSIPTFTPTTAIVATATASSTATTRVELTGTVPVPTITPSVVRTSPTPLASTQTPTPSRTPVPSPSAPFELVSQEDVCNPALPKGLLQVEVSDRGGHPLAGIEITITWSQGEERFFTGFQPEISAGYADYVMNAGTTYSVQLARLGVPVSGITAPLCPSPGGQTYPGGKHLTFREP